MFISLNAFKITKLSTKNNFLNLKKKRKEKMRI